LEFRRFSVLVLLLTLLLGTAILPLSNTAAGNNEQGHPNQPLSVLVHEQFQGLKFVNTAVGSKQLHPRQVTTQKVGTTILERLGSLGPQEKIPVIIQFGAQVAKPADMRKGSAFLGAFAGANPSVVVTGFYPQVRAIEVNATANLIDAFARSPQIVHVYDPLIKVQAGNYYSTQYHQAVIAWALHSMGAGSVIAILDTGWNGWGSYTTDICSPDGCGPHPDLQNLASPYTAYAVRDFTGDTDNPPWHDWFGHGTHVSGIALGQGVQDPSQKGMAPQAKLMVGKVLDDTGSGLFSWIMRGLIWSAGIDPDTGLPTGLKANVVNLSIWSPGSWGDGTYIAEQIADEIALQGTLPVIIAGNGGPSSGTVSILGAAKNAVTVGAVLDDTASPPSPWQVADFSSRGPTADGRTKPDISAIGVDVTSTIPPRSGSFADSWPPYYGLMTGTSMAAPQVSGGAALLASGRRNAQTDSLKAMLLSSWVTQYQMSPSGDTNAAGHGFLQVDDSFHAEFLMGTVTTPKCTYNPPSLLTCSGTGQNVDFPFYLTDPSIPIRAVLTWLDPSTDTLTPYYGALVHDLDLYLIDPAGHTVSASHSSVDNVELVDYQPASDPHFSNENPVGTWKIRINYYANRLGYGAAQHFSVTFRTGFCGLPPYWPCGPTDGPITTNSIAAAYMRPTDTMVIKPTIKNLRTDTDATGGGPRIIELDHWLWSPATAWVFAGWTTYTLNPSQTLTPTISILLAPLNLPFGTYTLEEDAFASYPTNGAQFISASPVGSSWTFNTLYITPAVAASIVSVKTNALNYLRGQTATITVSARNVGTQPYKGTVSLVLMDPSNNVAAVIPSTQVNIAVGGTLTVNVAWRIPTSLPSGPITYKIIASTGTQGWTSSATTNVIIT
jgi:hypothetical protein